MLTPNILMKGFPNQFLEEDLDKLHYLDEEKQVTKRMVYLYTTRQLLKKRLVSPRPPGPTEQGQTSRDFSSWICRSDHGQFERLEADIWNLAKVIEEIRGKYGVIRGLRLKSTSGYIVERPLQLIRDLEIQGAAQKTCADQVTIHDADEPPT